VGEARWAKAEGTDLAFDVIGDGPLVTLVHAGLADRIRV